MPRNKVNNRIKLKKKLGMFKNNSLIILSLSCLSNNHLRDGYVNASRVMDGLFVDPDLTYPGGINTEASEC